MKWSLDELIWDDVCDIIDSELIYPLSQKINKKFVKPEVQELLDVVVAATVWESVGANSMDVIKSKI